jgi:Protein tyrosine and serine/threonine kinase
VAPEVALGKPYNEKSDVYSISILAWQIMSLDAPFSGYNMSMIKTNVYNGNTRPKCDPKWSDLFSAVLRRGWCATVADRPTMKQFIEEIRKELSAQTGTYYQGGADVIDNSHRGEGSGRVRRRNVNALLLSQPPPAKVDIPAQTMSQVTATSEALEM